MLKVILRNPYLEETGLPPPPTMPEPCPFQPLELPALLKQAASLPTWGHLGLSRDKLCYLKLSDAYIHKLFPLLTGTPAKKPNYFGTGLVGAHISVVYPGENRDLPTACLGVKHDFSITGAFTAELGLKRYYVLGVAAPGLLSLRRSLDLPDSLAFKNYWVTLHITIGVCSI